MLLSKLWPRSSKVLEPMLKFKHVSNPTEFSGTTHMQKSFPGPDVLAALSRFGCKLTLEKKGKWETSSISWLHERLVLNFRDLNCSEEGEVIAVLMV